MFDPENTGLISYRDFQHICTEMGEKIKLEEVKEIIKLLNFDEN